MSRKFLKLFIIVLFLTVQLGAVLHNAAYGFDAHDHGDEQCDIYLFGEHSVSDVPVPVDFPAPEFFSSLVFLQAEIQTVQEFYIIAHPRGPPKHLLS